MEAGKYWSMESFLCEEEPVLVKMKCNGKGLAYLDEQADPTSTDLKEGKELKMPLWLATSLAEKDYVYISPPLYLGKAYKDSMKADPTSINIKERSPYLFEIGKLLSDYLGDSELPPTLTAVFTERYKKIVDCASSTKVSETSGFAAKLTTIEKSIFDARQEYLHNHEIWKNRNASKIEVHKEIAPMGKRWKIK